MAKGKDLRQIQILEKLYFKISDSMTGHTT